MKIKYRIPAGLLILLSIIGSAQSAISPFVLKETDEGVDLSEKGLAVFHFQKKSKALQGKYVCSNYLHPVYDLKGNVITEESPPDHPYHRGIYWAWHQFYINDKSLGDGWVMENISQEVVGLKTDITGSTAQFRISAVWKSPNWKNGAPFIGEQSTIIVHKSDKDTRKIDFEIALKALTSGVEIGGADDEKGYGGFCVRIKLPDNMIFTSSTGRVTPQNTQIIAGSWMDFSASFGKTSDITGLAILCHPATPNYPAPWILRQKASMQNIVFPGRSRIKLSPDKPVVLRYRVVIHNGNAESISLQALQSEYEYARKMTDQKIN
jgi:hypothetical protein